MNCRLSVICVFLSAFSSFHYGCTVNKSITGHVSAFLTMSSTIFKCIKASLHLSNLHHNGGTENASKMAFRRLYTGCLILLRGGIVVTALILGGSEQAWFSLAFM